MNSDPNNDSKQCSESKLGRVHRVHTQRTQVARTLHTHCAQATRTPQVGRRVVAPLRPCRSAHWSCHRPCRELCRAPCRRPSFTIQSLYRNTTPYRAHRALCRARCSVCRSAPALCRKALGAVSQPLACCVATPGRPPVTIQTILLRQNPTARLRSRTLPLALHVGRPCRRASWSYRRAMLQRRAARPSACSAVSRPLSVRSATLCQDTIFCIVTQYKKNRQ